MHYWRTGGSKPVLIMAHGSSDDGLCWTNLAKESKYDSVKKELARFIPKVNVEERARTGEGGEGETPAKKKNKKNK